MHGSVLSETQPFSVGEPLVAGAAAFAARRAAGHGTPPVAERRQVSILFVDLVAFTELVAGRDPEEVRDLLDRYFETGRATIGRYGGTLEKFIGDAVMAVWGTPVAHEDDAERAVRAALDLVAAVGGLGAELGLAGLAARGGVVTGEAAVTVGAVGQGMVAGDVVNTASRLQGAASPGSVLVDETTHRIVRESIAFRPAGALVLRGIRQPVAAYEARQVVALRRGRGRSPGLEGPLVGRDGPLAVAKELLDTVRVARTVRQLSIVGQAGVGKSRIVWELEKYVDGVVEPVWWHHAGSPAYGEGLAFWALAEMVRARAGIGGGESPEVARQRLATCLARFVPDATERRWIAPFLAALVDLGPATGGEREEQFAAWRTFFERISDQGTTVLVFDDLHWADAGLLDFVDDIVERSTGPPAAGRDGRPAGSPGASADVGLGRPGPGGHRPRAPRTRCHGRAPRPAGAGPVDRPDGPHPRACRGDPPVCRRAHPDARRPGRPGAVRRRVRGPRTAGPDGGARDAARPRRGAHRRPRPGRRGAPPRGGRARRGRPARRARGHRRDDRRGARAGPGAPCPA